MTMYFKITYFTTTGNKSFEYVDKFLQHEIGNPDICRLKIGERHRIIKSACGARPFGISSEWRRLTKEEYAVYKL